MIDTDRDDDTRLQCGFTSPMVRRDPLAVFDAPVRRRPIGFVHFGEPEPERQPEPETFSEYVREYGDVI